ncbi:hypothetical protein Bca52824_006902 [Brassica carinata]|uniref:Uncharacterized protein n=1 Tax=Brassica carinata TaxID=52824 RepID=A0A8X8B4X1_BRACI|nr:hypothetical protein Bca52824_006902 [Brassica carinata]
MDRSLSSTSTSSDQVLVADDREAEEVSEGDGTDNTGREDMDNIGGLEVSSTSLDILVIEDTSFGKEGFFLSSPKLQFTKNFWVAGRFAPHISYNISKEEKSIVHEEFMNNISGGLCELIGDVDKSMSVNIDLMNRTEVERLRQVLGLWIHEMLALEITFKDNGNATNES